MDTTPTLLAGIPLIAAGKPLEERAIGLARKPRNVRTAKGMQALQCQSTRDSSQNGSRQRDTGASAAQTGRNSAAAPC